jgi:hypothetical protein
MSSSSTSAPLELVYSDVWGPVIDSFGRKKYYVSFIDDYSKFTWIYLLCHKSKVSQFFLEFQQLVECMTGNKIITVQSDWGGEYERLNSFFRFVGISHHVSCPHTHQQNGAAEQKHRHIVEMGLALLAYASMPLKYWDETFLAAIYLINRTPTKLLSYDTPLDEDINYNTSTSTPATPFPVPPDAPSPQAPTSSSPGPITRARARELNFVMLLKNEGPEE